MAWCNSRNDNRALGRIPTPSPPLANGKSSVITPKSCPSCGHPIQFQEQAIIRDLPGLPAGVKFDPTDQELLEHLQGKAKPEAQKPHPLIDEFIPTLQGENGICYTHPEKLPGVGKDGLVRHFFHRPSKAYTTGTRKRRKVHTDAFGSETRWHKTGKTKPVFAGGGLKGFKKILVLYTNYGKQRKPEKTNWVMHQYHLGSSVEEKEGELVVSKVFYQTQPRQCGSTAKNPDLGNSGRTDGANAGPTGVADFYYDSFLSYGHHGGHIRASPPHLIPNFSVHAHGSSLLH
ncbi:unnamed protein product [Spirodela intermedia]|uniref:NAC domain-containing protein n=1 Tax=Spirodela intermedia TaxID=51605 RepID=A0A7I8L016_SPIIN|nr:unnamed protein product [Spirodela intermedia]